MTLVRACGVRARGAIYCVVGTSENGLPVEAFLVDPPIVVDSAALGLTSTGVKLIKRAGVDVWDVWDIVGGDSYPNVADFIEEVRRFGVSRRLPKTLDFSKLTAASRLVLLHGRAHIENFADYFAAGDWWNSSCPKGLDEHREGVGSPGEMCAGLWWDDLDCEEPECNPAGGYEARAMRRKMPGFEYIAHSRPENVTPDYKLAIFSRFPISNLAVIRDPDGSDEEAMQAATKAGLPVTLESE